MNHEVQLAFQHSLRAERITSRKIKTWQSRRNGRFMEEIFVGKYIQPGGPGTQENADHFAGMEVARVSS